MTALLHAAGLLAMLTAARSQEPTVRDPCACTGSNLNEQWRPGVTLVDDPDYGIYCAAWDSQKCEEWWGCTGVLGYWCCRSWCYVTSDCPGAPISSNHPGLYYSYDVCPDNNQTMAQCQWADGQEWVDGAIPCGEDGELFYAPPAPPTVAPTAAPVPVPTGATFDIEAKASVTITGLPSYFATSALEQDKFRAGIASVVGVNTMSITLDSIEPGDDDSTYTVSYHVADVLDRLRDPSAVQQAFASQWPGQTLSVGGVGDVQISGGACSGGGGAVTSAARGAAGGASPQWALGLATGLAALAAAVFSK